MSQLRSWPQQRSLPCVCGVTSARLSLFGSVIEATNRRTAIDLLVEFEPEARPSLLTMTEIELDLSPLVGGRKVELRMLRVEPISMTKCVYCQGAV